jgi:YVTN family beta-propeller protein
VGKKPWNVIFNKEGTIAVVSASGSDQVTIIDTATRRVIQRIPAGNGPFFSVYNSDESKLYVSNSGNNHAFEIGSLTIIDTSTYAVIDTVTLEKQPFDLTFVNPAR